MASFVELLREGLDHHRAGRLKQAEHSYRKVLEVHPRHAGAVHLLGLIAFQAGKVDLAIHHLQTAIKLDRFQAAFHADLGEIYRSMGLLADAIGAYKSAIALNPEDSSALCRLGTLYYAVGEPELALESLREAISLKREHAEAHRHLGEVLAATGQLDEARASLERSVQLDSTAAETYYALGHCLDSLGRTLDAIACYQKAVRLKNDMAPAHYCLALARLAEGDYENGWRDLEWRLKCPDRAIVDTRPRWQGGSLDGRRILIHSEGALSDVIQFARYVPVVTRRGGEVFFEVPEQLMPLLTASGYENLIARGTAAPPCELQAPLLSLPHLVGTRLETVLADVPYLAPPADLVSSWTNQFAPVRGFKVGICWQGNPRAEDDLLRSIPLEAFAPLAAVAGVRLISLQRVDGLEQLASWKTRLAIVEPAGEVDERHGALVDTAAIMKSLDLVISCDTAVAHLAGALAVPVWIGLSSATQWRWMRDRADSPWYPTARLFRQSRAGDWTDVMNQMAQALAPLAAGRG